MPHAAPSPEWWKQQDIDYLLRLCERVVGPLGVQCTDVHPGRGPARHFVVVLRSGEEAFLDVPYDLIQQRREDDIRARLRNSIAALFPPLYEGSDEGSQKPTGT